MPGWMVPFTRLTLSNRGELDNYGCVCKVFSALGTGG